MNNNKVPIYKVVRLQEAMKIDGNWQKPQWQKVKALSINHYMGAIPKFKPETEAKMMYDDEHLYLLFRVQDNYVRCVVQEYNGPVWKDACVEFFFAPDVLYPERYFNLEINGTGIPLMRYNTLPRKEYRLVDTTDLKKIEIAHSLPAALKKEINEPVIWTIEFRIPLSLLEKYADITHPKKGIHWKANFYKTADEGSNPHWITWSLINNPTPDFHRPRFFGNLQFQ